jgi:hypothetical protein
VIDISFLVPCMIRRWGRRWRSNSSPDLLVVTGKVLPFTLGNDTQAYHEEDFIRQRRILFEKANKSNRIRQGAERVQLVGVPGGGISKSERKSGDHACRATKDILQTLCSIHTLLASGRSKMESLKLYQIKTGGVEMHGEHDRYARGYASTRENPQDRT